MVGTGDSASSIASDPFPCCIATTQPISHARQVSIIDHTGAKLGAYVCSNRVHDFPNEASDADKIVGSRAKNDGVDDADRSQDGRQHSG
jgi:hypothetical protein